MASTHNSDRDRPAGESELLLAALDYVERGLAVIPLEPFGKRPLLEWAPYKERRPSEEQVRAWWGQWPDANVGIVTGAVSGIVALDVDGREARRALASRGFTFPHTPISRTAKGWHVFFAHPGFTVPNAVAMFPNVDLRGDGGYVVAPPSVHPSGLRYEWVITLDAVPLAPMPADLLAKRAKEAGGNGTLSALVRGVPEGERNVNAAVLVGSLLARYPEGAWEDVCWPLVVAWNQNNQPGLSAPELRGVFESIAQREQRKRSLAGQRWNGAPPGRGPGTAIPQPLGIILATVQPERVSWLWPGRIPLGKVTVLDGDPDLGKSLITLDLASRVSAGRAMPDGSVGDLAGPRGVVLLTAEDDLSDTVRPRLDAAGADSSRILALDSVPSPEAAGVCMPTLADLDAIEEAIRQVDAALVVIDPLVAFLPPTSDSHKDQHIRRVLAPLAKLAARTGTAILAVRHLNKTGGGNPLYRGGGSIGIIGAARSGLLAAKDPDNPNSEMRILAVTKSNLSAKAPALAYRVEATNGVAHVHWEGETDHTAETLLAPARDPEEHTALERAKDFLWDTLAWGPKPAVDVKEDAEKIGIKERTLRRARAELGIATRKVGFSGGWVWELPPAKTAKNTEGDKVQPDGHLGGDWPPSSRAGIAWPLGSTNQKGDT